MLDTALLADALDATADLLLEFERKSSQVGVVTSLEEQGEFEALREMRVGRPTVSIASEVEKFIKFSRKGPRNREFVFPVGFPTWLGGYLGSAALVDAIRISSALRGLETTRVSSSESTIEEHRIRAVDRFSHDLVDLWKSEHNGPKFVLEFMKLWDAAVVDVMEEAGDLTSQQIAAQIGPVYLQLTQKAEHAATQVQSAISDGTFDESFVASANWIAGSLWAIYWAGKVAVAVPNPLLVERANNTIQRRVKVRWSAMNDHATCQDCAFLNDQEFEVDSIPQYPGDGNTQCGGNCRCSLEFFESTEDSGEVNAVSPPGIVKWREEQKKLKAGAGKTGGVPPGIARWRAEQAAKKAAGLPPAPKKVVKTTTARTAKDLPQYVPSLMPDDLVAWADKTLKGVGDDEALGAFLRNDRVLDETKWQILDEYNHIQKTLVPKKKRFVERIFFGGTKFVAGAGERDTDAFEKLPRAFAANWSGSSLSGKGSIGFNVDWYGRSFNATSRLAAEQHVQRTAFQMWNVGGADIASTTIHELGHSIDGMLSYTARQDIYAMAKELGTVSGYAKTNEKEALAEAFADFWVGTRSPVSVKMMEIVLADLEGRY